MTIKRDILGTIVNIELTDQELTEAHIAYLEQEIKALKAGTPSSTPTVKSTEIMPADQKTEAYFAARFSECAEEIRRVPLHDAYARALILDRYQNDIRDAYAGGLTQSKIAMMTRTSLATITNRCIGIKRTRNMMVA